ncbi:MAG: tripartite tricarboxylate transporter substrate binding protein [Alphaproteobacteria bacterium]|nr:tripartite tricarboxylate transporter substrate binding protein [Alphaproteobacteria bacterium]
MSLRAGCVALALAVSVVLLPQPSNGQGAEGFPRRQIQLWVAAPAGGPTDVGARIVASIAEKLLGQPMVVVNKPGAGGQVGITEFTRQKADGYNIGFVFLPGVNTIVLDPERKAVFTMDDFTPLINQVLDPGVIWVKADSPYKTLDDLVRAARKEPSKVTACTTGILGDDHLAILMLEEAAKVKFRIVHLEGAAGQLTAILGGHVESAFDNVGSVAKRAKSGEVRILATMDPERSKFVPDVPTTKELGYPSVVSNSTRGIVAPKGLPAPIAQKLRAALRQAMEDPEHIRRMEETGLALKLMEGDEYAKYIKDIHARAAKYTEVAKRQ